MPLDPAGSATTCIAVSIYQVRGELVIRAELDTAPSPREACAAYGFDAITWVDENSPIS